MYLDLWQGVLTVVPATPSYGFFGVVCALKVPVSGCTPLRFSRSCSRSIRSGACFAFRSSRFALISCLACACPIASSRRLLRQPGLKRSGDLHLKAVLCALRVPRSSRGIVTSKCE